MISRENAIFKEQTRILRQAEELSVKLLRSLQSNENPYLYGIEQTGNKVSIVITEITQLTELEKNISSKISIKSQRIDSSFAIPIFLETITYFYEHCVNRCVQIHTAISS
jgi:hypothetical protein